MHGGFGGFSIFPEFQNPNMSEFPRFFGSYGFNDPLMKRSVT